MPVNQEKLQKLQSARIGGKGTSRRKKKIVHKTATDDKKVQVRNKFTRFVGNPLVVLCKCACSIVFCYK